MARRSLLNRLHERHISPVIKTLDRADLRALPAAHRHDRLVARGVVRPRAALVDDPRQLAAEARVLLAEPHLPQRLLEDVAEGTRLQDAARRDHAGRAHDQRMPADQARLVEAGDLAGGLLPPGPAAGGGGPLHYRDVAARDGVR